MKQLPLIIVGHTLTTILNGKTVIGTLTPQQLLEVITRNSNGTLTKKFLKKQLEVVQQDFLKASSLKASNLFKVDGKKVFRKGFPKVSLPKLLVEQYLNFPEETIALDNFWRWSLLNPDPQARKDLFSFLKGGRFTITPNGYIVTYRNVAVKNAGNKELHDYVIKEWIRIRKNKKSTKAYFVEQYKDGYTISISNTENSLGSVYDLYQSINEITETVYTDNYTRTFEIKIGEVVRMKREDCDSNPESDCSNGLNGSPAY
jgi:hypothetical protein